MKNRIIIILIFIVGHFSNVICQDFAYVATCDYTYSEYKIKKTQVSKTFRKICNNYSLSKKIKKELTKAIQNEDYRKLESVLYWILHEEWCTETEKLAREVIKLNIPSLNSWILTEATSNYVDIDCNNVTELCYFQYGSYKLNEIEEMFGKEKDEVRLAHLALLLSQVLGKEILNQLTLLRNAQNVFARFTFAQLLFFFEQYEESEMVLRKSLEQEIQSLKRNIPYSINHVYASWSIRLLQRINNEDAYQYHEIIEKLYDESMAFYEKLENKSTDQINIVFGLESAKFELNKVYEIKKCP